MVPEFAQNAEQDFHRSLRCLDESLRVRVVAGQRRAEQQPVPVWLGHCPGPVGAREGLEPGARFRGSVPGWPRRGGISVAVRRSSVILAA